MAVLTGAQAGDRTWTGSPMGGYWDNAANWGGTVPSDQDALFFPGTNYLASTNDFTGFKTFSSLTFDYGSGPFLLAGAPIGLTSGITNRSAQAQTNWLDLQIGTLAIYVTNGSTLLLNGALLSTNASITKYGRGTVLLNGPNNYAGTTTIRRGTVKIQSNARLGTIGSPLVLDGGTLGIGNIVTLLRPITVTSNGGTFNVDQLSTLTVTNRIDGPGTLVTRGAGTVVLAVEVASRGSLQVQAGVLNVDGVASGPTNLTVYAGARLGGKGTLWGDVVVQDGGALAPGTNDVRGPATLTVSNLFLSPNSITRFDLNAPGVMGGTNDLLVVRGNLTLDGTLKVTGNGTNGLYPIIRYEGALVDNGIQLGPAVAGNLIIDSANRLIWLNATNFPAAPPAAYKMFFIGNSLTYTYDIPGTIRNLALAAGDWFSYGSDLVAGSSLQDHVGNANTMALLDTGNYDLVMLQDFSSYPSTPFYRDNYTFPAARYLDSHIVSHGQRTIFYQTWGYPYGDPAHCATYDVPAQYQGCGCSNMIIATRMGYARIANELNAAISPVGQAWLTVQNERPDINLYYNTAGDYHPGPAGSYLAACVHYASIFGRSPVGNSHLGLLADASLAGYLQTVAERVVLADPWAMDPYGFASNRYCWAVDWPNFTNRTYSKLTGQVISGTGGLTSPAVLVNGPAGATNRIYLGVYSYNYEQAGQGRLFVRSGGSLRVSDTLVVGKEGLGSVQQDGGSMQVDGLLVIAEQPSSRGQYLLNGGVLLASHVQPGMGDANFILAGGQLAFSGYGTSNALFDLNHRGGVLAPSNSATIFGSYFMGDSAVYAPILGVSMVQVQGGTANLAGEIFLACAPGFVPSPGQQFTVLTADSINGRFSRVRSSPLPDNRVLVLNYTANAVTAAVLDGLADTNANGLPDWWEIQYFGTLDSGQTWMSSFAGDAIPNGVKYAFLLDPTKPAPTGGLPVPDFASGYPTLSYRQHTGGVGTVGVDYTADNLTYRVAFSSELPGAAWLTGTNYVVWTGSRIDNGDGTETVTVQTRDPLGVDGQKFLRLQILH